MVFCCCHLLQHTKVFDTVTIAASQPVGFFIHSNSKKNRTILTVNIAASQPVGFLFIQIVKN
jgi:hypothetical protein